MTVYEKLEKECGNAKEAMERLQDAVGESLHFIIKAGAGKGFEGIGGRSGETLEKIKSNKEGTDLICEPVADEFKTMYNDKLVELWNNS